MSGDMSQSSLNLTSDEKRTYGQLFQEADPNTLGIVTGEVAVRFFERTRLDPTILGAIWQIGDKENRGFLTPAGFSVVLRLIGHAQAGREPSVELSKSPGPLPKFENDAASTSITTGPQAQGAPIPIRVPPLTPDKVSEYSSLFEKAGAQGGLLGGDAARQVFERARLPNEVLGQIWNLADTDQKGALNVTGFVIAMHFLTSMRSGAMRALPQSLPVGLYEAATRRAPPPVAQIALRSTTGNASQRVQSSATRPLTSPISQQNTGSDWLVTPRDKAKFDEIFAGIDKNGQGHITGDQAVTFFGDSRLPEEVLAQIWDLSDIHSEGRLTRDEFAVAMYLIRQERAQTMEKRGALPSTLPAKLVPPSMRQQSMPPSQTTAPAFDNAKAASQQPSSAADDLFGLDALADDASDQLESASKGKGSFSPPLQPSSPISNAPRVQGTAFKPFTPTSSFGQGLASQNTGASVQSHQSQSRNATNATEDLLGDNDPEISQKLTSETSELANMSNQITQLRTQMQDVQNKKTLTAQSLANTTGQKQDLERRLAQFRAQYEDEIREVKGLEDRLTASRNETRKLQQELAMVEGAHQDLLSQHQQISKSLEADQRENALLKQRMQDLTLENTQMKANLEKAKSEARQQKGLVAINKKQVTTNEAESEKLQSQLSRALNGEQEDQAHELPPEQDKSSIVSRPNLSPHATNPFSRISPHSPFDGSTSTVTNANMKFNPFDKLFETENPPTDTHPQPVSRPYEDTPEASNKVPRPLASRESTAISQTEREPTVALGSGETAQTVMPLVKGGDHDPSPINADVPHGTIEDSLRNHTSELSQESAPELLSSNADSRSKSIERQEDDRTPPKSDMLGADIPGAFPGEHVLETTHDDQDSSDNAILKASEPTDTGLATKPSDDHQLQSTSTATRAGVEFPPIQDVEQEESDSDIDTGFEDNFSPVTPQVPFEKDASARTATDNEKGLSESQNLTAKPEVGHESTQAEAPPAAGFQQSPPAYEAAERRGSTSNSGRESNQFPQQYHGLLPSREITNSPPDEIVQNTPQTIASTGSQKLDSHKEVMTNDTNPNTSTGSSVTAAPVASAVHKDEFDDAFDDLSEAQEEAGNDYSEAATGEETEFNPTFTASALEHATPNNEHSKLDTRGDVNSTNARSEDEFASFEPSSSILHSDNSQSAVTNDKADWDAIFAGIDKPPGPAESSKAKSPFDVGSSANALLSIPAVGGLSHTSKDASRPSLGRAISQGTEHDDPILKTLTSMGYPRDSALKALEKYDYNLDKAADHLASKS